MRTRSSSGAASSACCSASRWPARWKSARWRPASASGRDAVHVAGGRVGGEHLADVRRLALEHEDRVGRLREERGGALLALAERAHRLVALGRDGADEQRGQRADGQRRLDQQRLALARARRCRAARAARARPARRPTRPASPRWRRGRRSASPPRSRPGTAGTRAASGRRRGRWRSRRPCRPRRAPAPARRARRAGPARAARGGGSPTTTSAAARRAGRPCRCRPST